MTKRIGTCLVTACLFGCLNRLSAQPLNPPAPAGVHPRLIFSAEALPELRERAAEPRYRPLMEALHKASDAMRKQLDRVAADEAARKKLAKDCLGQWDYHTTNTRSVALYYQLSGDVEAGVVAADAFRFWLDANPPDEQLKANESWGSQEYALAYDWIYEQLSDRDRERARRIFSAMLGAPTRNLLDRARYSFGPTQTGRRITGANWMVLFGANLAMTALAIEGEIDCDTSILPDAVKLVESFLSECIDSDGALYEGMEYAMGFGTHHLPPLLMALRLRGLDIYKASNLPQMAEWLAYETLPWGFESFDHNKSPGRFAAGPLLTFCAREFGGRFLHGYRNAAMEEYSVLPDVMTGLLNGLPVAAAPAVGDLPLDRWFSARGQVFARSGWGRRDAMALFGVNPFGTGHTHADQGNFLLAANGTYFIADSGASYYDSHFHNLVHIDGVAQARRESGLDGFIRFADRNDYALLSDADLRLSYSRVLEGAFDGPFWWADYNPVQRADRRFLFVRGAAGPLLIVVDDLRKDEQPHQYSWLAHAPARLTVGVVENGFTVAERFGGRYLHTLARGRTASFIAREVPAGAYHGWLLVRSEPSPAGWASNNLFVNGRRVPYNEAYFGRGFHREGWDWLPLKPESSAEIEHAGGDLQVRLESYSGGQIALAVFTRQLDWKPGETVPAHGGDFVVFGVESLEQGINPWEVGEAPKGVLDAQFLGAPVEISIDRRHTEKTGRVAVRAERRDVEGQFVCVMAPHDEGDGRSLHRSGSRLVRRSESGTDTIVSGWETDHAAGAQTDAQVAVISRDAAGVICGYAMVGGSRLAEGAKVFIASASATHVLHDGRRMIVRATPGSRVSCLRLEANELLVNGSAAVLPEGDPVVIDVPAAEAGWNVMISGDGRVVDMTGAGPALPKIKAPDAVELRVNGVKRQFTRDDDGLIYPVLEGGVLTIHYRNRLTAAQLAVFESRREDGKIHYLLPSVPGRYRIRTGGVEEEAVTSDNRLPVVLPADAKTDYVEVTPLTSPLPAALWLATGPFAIPGVDGQDMADAVVRATMMHRLPPETAVDPEAVYESGGKTLRWVGGDSQDGWLTTDGKITPLKQWTFAENAPESGVNFMPVCGVRRGELCYAAVVINSPEAREAILQIGCDFWATAFVNGEEVNSERADTFVQRDGARFTGDSLLNAKIRLNKGDNSLLVKCRGGGGSNSFVARISDPGDLVFQRR